MMVLFISQNWLPGSEVEFHVQSVRRALAGLERLHSGRLLYPTLEYTAHAFDSALTQFMRLASVIIYASGNTETDKYHIRIYFYTRILTKKMKIDNNQHKKI